MTSSRRRVPVAASERVRHVLGEDAHRVHALRRDARIVGRLKIELGPEPFRQFAGAGRLIGRSPLLLGERRVDLAEMMRHSGSGPGREAGQLVEDDVQLDGAADLRDRFDPGPPGRIGVVAQQAQGRARVGVRDDARRLDPLAPLELDARRRG